MIDMTMLMTDPDFTRSFSVKRRAGSFVKGRYVSTEEVFSLVNPIMPSSPREIQLLPEGDRSSEAITIYTPTKLYVTSSSEGESRLSDLVLFGNKQYKVVSCLSWDKYGYYKVVAVDIGGV